MSALHSCDPGPRRKNMEWISTLLLTLLMVLYMLVALYIDRNHDTGGVLQLSRIISLATAILFAGLLLFFRKRSSRLLTASIFFIVFSAILAGSAAYHFQHLRANEPWIPFMGQKLAFFGLCVFVSGPYWINALWMALSVAEVILLWLITDVSHVPIFESWWEPWYTLFFAIMASILLAFRAYSDRVLQRLVEERERYRHLEHLTHVFLSIRDLANTPLQNLTLGLEILRHEAKNEEISQKMNNAIVRLASLNTIFKYLEKRFWSEDTPKLMNEREIIESLRELQTSDPHPDSH